MKKQYVIYHTKKDKLYSSVGSVKWVMFFANATFFITLSSAELEFDDHVRDENAEIREIKLSET